MQITLNPQEKHYLREKAEKYREETGDNYALFYILALLSERYEENFAKDLEEIIDIKIKEYKEQEV